MTLADRLRVAAQLLDTYLDMPVSRVEVLPPANNDEHEAHVRMHIRGDLTEIAQVASAWCGTLEVIEKGPSGFISAESVVTLGGVTISAWTHLSPRAGIAVLGEASSAEIDPADVLGEAVPA